MAHASWFLPLALIAAVGVVLTVRHGRDGSHLTSTVSIVAARQHAPTFDDATTVGGLPIGKAQEVLAVALPQEETVTGLRLEERPPEELVALALGAHAAEDRVAAVDALAYSVPSDSGKHDYVLSVLVQALMDRDARVRAQALATLKDSAPELPLAALAQVARDDPEPLVRVQALELLVERSADQARTPLTTALADPEPVVRDRARALIEDLHLMLEEG